MAKAATVICRLESSIPATALGASDTLVLRTSSLSHSHLGAERSQPGEKFAAAHDVLMQGSPRLGPSEKQKSYAVDVPNLSVA